MVKSFSIWDIILLGYKEARETTASSGGDQPFQVFSATSVVGLRQISDTFVYLKANCTRQGVEEAARAISNKRDAYVIVPQSLRIAKTTLESIFALGIQIHVYEDLMWERIYETFSGYIDSLRTDIPREKYYVPPREDKGDPKVRFDDEIIKFFKKGRAGNSGEIVVVCASAGVGKTTLTRQVVTKLADNARANRVIPVYVEAEHWGKLKLESIEELWEIIDNSIHTFTPLSLSEALFEHALRQGYLVFVFDGFDELCGQRQSHFNPREVLHRLSRLAEDSDAKVVLTTRTLYWKAAIDALPERVRELYLAPFNSSQAKDYYSKFFPREPKLRDRASAMYHQLLKSNRPQDKGGTRAQFVNVPLCVGMIADYVQSGGTRQLDDEKKLITEVLVQMCQRERIRKKLNSSAQIQLKGFEDIAIYKMDEPNPQFKLEELGMTEIQEVDIPKFIDHILLNRNGEMYSFNYEFLPQYLRALYLCRQLATKKSERDMWKLMSLEANGKGYMLEHLAMLLDTGDLDTIQAYYEDVPVEFPDAKSFLFHLARVLIDNSEPVMSERTDRLFALVGGDDFKRDRKITDLHIIGQVARLDLSNIMFSDCVFSDVTFTKCSANERTTFYRCRFAGELDFPGYDPGRWNKVKLIDCTLVPPTNLIWEEVRGERASNESREDHIRDALRLALGKFWFYGRMKSTLKKGDWYKGSLGHSIYCKPVLQAMLKTKILSEVTISGSVEGGYRFSKEALGDLQRFMDSGQMIGRIKEVADQLTKKT